jgi:YD repeat-containing protein
MTRYFEEGSASFTYNYDERGRLTSIENHFNGTTDTTVCECDEDGRWLRQESPDTTAVYTYDSEGFLVSMVYEEHFAEEGIVIDSTDTYTYTYDSTGKIISSSITGRSTSHMEGNPDTIEERTGTETYVYDENDVLQRVLTHLDFNIYIADGSGHAFSDPVDMTEEYGY